MDRSSATALVRVDDSVAGAAGAACGRSLREKKSPDACSPPFGIDHIADPCLNPNVFNPTDLDAENWMAASAALGMREIILTAHHEGGFALWPSKFTNCEPPPPVFLAPFGDDMPDTPCHPNPSCLLPRPPPSWQST